MILLTGFKRFGVPPVSFLPNPSATLVERLGADPPVRDFATRVLDVSWEAPQTILEAAATVGATSIVMLGSAPIGRPRAEVRALKLCRGRDVDRKPPPQVVCGPISVSSDPELVGLAQAAGGLELGSESSSGSYICNWSLYEVARRHTAILIHVPRFRRASASEESIRDFLVGIEARASRSVGCR